MVKFYDDQQIQWLRENNMYVYYTTQASTQPSTDTRKPVPGSSYSCTDAQVVHTPRLGTYSWLRAASCPPCVPALSWLSPCTEDLSLAAGWAQPLQPCMQQENIAKSATKCQQKIIFHGNNWFVKCKVHWMQLLTWAEKKESICRSSGRLPRNSSR